MENEIKDTNALASDNECSTLDDMLRRYRSNAETVELSEEMKLVHYYFKHSTTDTWTTEDIDKVGDSIDNPDIDMYEAVGYYVTVYNNCTLENMDEFSLTGSTNYSSLYEPTDYKVEVSSSTPDGEKYRHCVTFGTGIYFNVMSYLNAEDFEKYELQNVVDFHNEIKEHNGILDFFDEVRVSSFYVILEGQRRFLCIDKYDKTVLVEFNGFTDSSVAITARYLRDILG